MLDLNHIIENYKQLTTNELVQLAASPGNLEAEVIPHLQAELFNRNKKEEAISLGEFLVKRPKSYQDLTKAELTEIIEERINSGELLESIKLDLQDKGIDIFELLNENVKLKDRSLNYLTSLKADITDEEEVDNRMKNTLSINENELDQLKQELKRKGNRNLVIGYSILFIVAVLSLVAERLTIGGVILICLGIWRIYEGHKQIK